MIQDSEETELTNILLFTLKKPSASVTTVGFDAPTAMMAPCHGSENSTTNVKKQKDQKKMLPGHKPNSPLLTWPGGSIASNLSTPNMPRLESVKVPTGIIIQFYYPQAPRIKYYNKCIQMLPEALHSNKKRRKCWNLNCIHAAEAAWL